MKTILLPTDFSKGAREAYHYAFKTFGTDNVRYLLINSYILPGNEMLICVNDLLRQRSEEGLKKEFEYIRSLPTGKLAKIEWLSENGPLDAVLNDIISQQRVHTIVMGNSGTSGTHIGSKFLQKSNCRVLTAPSSPAFQSCYIPSKG